MVDIADYDALLEAIADLHAPEPGRRREVERELAAHGTYTQTREELVAGAKMAWRNHARCNGRMHWRSLRLRDCRDAESAADVYAECLEHLTASTNGGALRAVISVFGPRGPAREGFRLLNPQLIRYAGYRNPDGTVTGDPLHVQLTEIAVALGWRSPHTHFDVLPLLILDPAGHVTVWEIPPDHVHEVAIEHPDYPGIGELGLRWHVNPAISDKLLEIGGVTYPLTPFSGWYVSSEIGARNLSDTARYDRLPAVARAMGLDTSRSQTLWQDRAVVELTFAVQHSFTAAGVHVVDHHHAAEQFVRHCEREAAAGRRTATDWTWVNPPISASTTPTFHRTFDPADFSLRPNFVTREDLLASVAPGLLRTGEAAVAVPAARDACPYQHADEAVVW
ncbi:MAG: nitric oxide synthase oxygenase [Nocardioides sp.]